jgi:hypothetical protein
LGGGFPNALPLTIPVTKDTVKLLRHEGVRRIFRLRSPLPLHDDLAKVVSRSNNFIAHGESHHATASVVDVWERICADRQVD